MCTSSILFITLTGLQSIKSSLMAAIFSLVGPPGTGKTLLARALAGEAQVPYFHVSGSEFEQTFVGEGAKRVRDLFRAAKQHAPCVVFIDEIDAVGSTRYHSPMHPHANQTINQLLTEMDGFNRNEGVIVLAATNRRQDLDSALLRPGRFDVEVFVPIPSYLERKDIIQYYLKGVVCEAIDTDILARGTVGFTGAHLQSMINRAALRAATDGHSYVTLNHIFSERDRILMGTESRDNLPDEVANKITAYHEGGHCVVALYTPHSQPIHKVSIVRRGETLGHTAYMPERDGSYVSKAQMLARIDGLLGGRAAEQLLFGSDLVTSGAASDLMVATELAEQMVARWGMSETIGLTSYKGSDQGGPTYKDKIDQEVAKILSESFERTTALLRKYSHQHQKIAQALLQHETLDSLQIQAIINEK